MARTREKGFWEKLVREVEAGSSQTTVARRHGVSQTWLGKWCRRLRASSTATLLPVRVVEQRARRVDVAVRDYRVSFEEGVEPGYVAALCRALIS
jgi:transposase-like protein